MRWSRCGTARSALTNAPRTRGRTARPASTSLEPGPRPPRPSPASGSSAPATHPGTDRYDWRNPHGLSSAAPNSPTVRPATRWPYVYRPGGGRKIAARRVAGYRRPASAAAAACLALRAGPYNCGGFGIGPVAGDASVSLEAEQHHAVLING